MGHLSGWIMGKDGLSLCILRNFFPIIKIYSYETEFKVSLNCSIKTMQYGKESKYEK